MRRITKVALLAVLAVLLGVWYVADRASGSKGASAPAGARTEAKGPATPVIGGQAEARDIPVWLSSIGSVQALNAVMLKARVDGQLDSVNFVEGQEVRAGDVLARIDPRPYRASLSQAQAAKAKDEAQLANARTDYARFRGLASAGAAPTQNVDALKAQVAALEASVQADQAAIEAAQLQLDFTTIRAPIAGRAGLRLIDPGSIIHTSDPSGIVTITQIEPIAALFSLPQDNLADVLSEMSTNSIDVVAWSRDGTTQLARGQLAFVDSQIDVATGQVRLKAVFPNAHRNLWPGELISVRVQLRTIANATVIPTKAVTRGQNGPLVFRIREDNTVEAVPVDLGFASEGWTVVKSGLSAGDRIVVDGQSRIQPGARVEAQVPVSQDQQSPR